MQRVVFTVRRTVHVVVASVVVELALDFGAGALAVVLAPFVGRWVYAVAGVVVVGSLPVLGLNIARVARREWRKTGARPRSGPGPGLLGSDPEGV
ncbi:MAG TPA: hypothetical protein VF091_05410 [Gaiellaceae bacterium]